MASVASAVTSMASAVTSVVSSVSTVVSAMTSVSNDGMVSLVGGHWSSVVGSDWLTDDVSLWNCVVVSFTVCDNKVIGRGVSRDAVNAIDASV